MRFTARAALRLAAVGVAASAVIIPTSPAFAATAPSLSASPSTGLKNAETVTVTGTHFAASKGFYMVQCSGSSQADCDISNLVQGTTTAKGGLSASFTVHTGAIGSGTCSATSTTCTIDATTDPNPSDTAAAATTKIAFGGTSSGPKITITPDTGVKNNTTVSVSGTGFPASKSLYVVECSSLTGEAGCDIGTLNSSGKTNSSGAFNSVKVKVHTGAVGNKSCTTTCYIAAATSTTPSPANSADAKFTFATKAKKPTHPALTVTPHKGVENRSHVRVSGSGFPAGKHVDLVECSVRGSKVSCNLKTFRTSKKTNARGAFKNVKIKVFAGKKTKKSCNAGGVCYLILGSTSKNPTVKNTAEKLFTFGKSKATRISVAVSSRRLVGKIRAAGKGISGLKATVEFKAGHKWKKVTKVKTRRHGEFRSAKLKRKGRYRIVLPRQRHGGVTYSSAISKTVRI